MKRKKLYMIIVILLIVATAGFYVYDMFVLHSGAFKNPFRPLALICLLVGVLLRTSQGGRKSLSIYEKAYDKELKGAFQDRPFLRKKLLCACRLYNEANYHKALKYLAQLYKDASSDSDKKAVLLFVALCYTDARVPGEAIKAYQELLNYAPANVQAHNNLGLLYFGEGDFETARYHYDKAIHFDPDHYYTYINRANYFFRTEAYDLAIEDCNQALAIKNNGVEAASLLTILYAMRQDEENKKKYFHLAITSGKKPEDLNEAIRYYTTEALKDSNP